MAKIKITPAKIRAFRTAVFTYYRAHGRHTLPWRKTHDPYRILVSEVMLQQTQVERVIPYYRAWLETYPTVSVLAKAPLSAALTSWQGLGYNRRAKRLHAAAKAVVELGRFPKTIEGLEALPGVGHYTARAVAAFAYNTDSIFIETNIRTVIIHHFFKSRNSTIYSTVSDSEITEVLSKVFPEGKAREWYAALMDYGSDLKRSGITLNARTKGYKKQSTFRGSAREARGAILKALVRGPRKGEFLAGVLGDDRVPQVKSQIAALTKEGMVVLSRGTFRLPK